MCLRPSSLSSTTGLLGIQRTHSISLDPGFLLLKEDDPQTVVHLILGEGWVVGSLPSGLCWHKRRFLGRLGGGRETQGEASQNLSKKGRLRLSEQAGLG